MTEFATLFVQAKTDSIIVDGRRIHSILHIRVEVPSLLRVRRLHASSDPVPGLRVKTYDGTAILNGEKLQELVFWSDTAPAEEEIKIIPKRKKIADVTLLNGWRHYRDGCAIMYAWLANAGMLVEQSDNTWILRCNSGPNKSLSFDDLVIEVNLTPQAKP
jgi:hypothetical protein